MRKLELRLRSALGSLALFNSLIDCRDAHEYSWCPCWSIEFCEAAMHYGISNSSSRDNVYGAVIVAVKCYCESSPGSFGQSSTSARWLPMFGPDRSIWTSDPPLGSYKYYTNHHHLLLLSPKADTHFTIPLRVEGWVDLAGWFHTEMVHLPVDSHRSWY